MLTIEGKNHKLAETIVRSTAGKNQKVLTMDSMQAMTSKDAALPQNRAAHNWHCAEKCSRGKRALNLR